MPSELAPSSHCGSDMSTDWELTQDVSGSHVVICNLIQKVNQSISCKHCIIFYSFNKCSTSWVKYMPTHQTSEKEFYSHILSCFVNLCLLSNRLCVVGTFHTSWINPAEWGHFTHLYVLGYQTLNITLHWNKTIKGALWGRRECPTLQRHSAPGKLLNKV